ncbi:MAG: histidine kinase [Burkholderiales bacterium]|nr:MAG: histidine kinase [Burkholderiales bacterium]
MDGPTLPAWPALCYRPLTARMAFARIFNLRTVAAVFYFCLAVAIGRMLMDLQYQALGEWAMSTLRFVRQNLISGLLLLATIALADSVATARRLRRRPALAAGVLLAAAGSAAAVVLRVWVYGSGISLAEEPAYLTGIWLTWTLLGSLAYALFYLTREDEQQRQMLCDAECADQTLTAQMLQARLSALQAQIEPHFLFNTLANVRRLYETTPERGREMLSCLIAYLRAALPSMRSAESSLGRELDLARSFLTILRMRMGERLQFSISAEAGLLDAAMPPMVLPTLVENAVKHGLGPLPEGGRIDIRAHRRGDDLLIEVLDTGVGFTAAKGSGVGLANTRSRLAGLYGSRASLQLSAGAPRGVVATLRLPLGGAGAAGDLAMSARAA